VPGISDTQCGFKLFSRAAAHKLFQLPKEKSWAFDVEILFLAQKFGMQIAQVPVAWHAVAGSKINPFKDSVRMFFALFRIRHRWSGLTS
jgi:dolichyl-phosphate beta-glucosyltransferase